ncbi:MAG: hypothetical protein GWP30_06950 [Actinobacteria bacterium]|nr:hypothetical protein [Actinomycetota bacterium]
MTRVKTSLRIIFLCSVTTVFIFLATSCSNDSANKEFSLPPEIEVIDEAKPKRICTELFYQIEYLRGSAVLTASAEAAVYALQRDFILLDCAVLNLGGLSE